MNEWLYKILGGVVTLVISISLLPILQTTIDGLTQFDGTPTGTLLDIIPMVLVVVFVLMAVTLIPKKNEGI